MEGPMMGDDGGPCIHTASPVLSFTPFLLSFLITIITPASPPVASASSVA
jgi:hypothetical protein